MRISRILATVCAVFCAWCSFATVWTVGSFDALSTAIQAASSGDYIELQPGHWVATSNVVIGKAGTLTFRTAGPVVWDLALNDMTITGAGGSAGTFHFVASSVGNFLITGQKPGSVWTVGGTSSAVVSVITTSGNVTSSFYGVAFSGGYAADRCVRTIQDVSGRTAYSYFYNCQFTASLDDNLNADIIAPGDTAVNNDPNQKAINYCYGCTFEGSRYGAGLTAHHYAKSYAYNSTFAQSLMLVPAGPGHTGRVELTACTLYGSPAAQSNALISGAQGSVMTLTDCNLYSYFQPASSGACAVTTPSGVSAATLTMTRCNVYQYANTSLIMVQANTTATLTDCNFYHRGDPRADTNEDIKVLGTLNLKRCIVDFQQSVSAGGTDNSPLLMLRSGGRLNADGCLFIRHNLSAISHIGIMVKTGASNSSYIKHCTFIGTGVGDAINLEGTNASPMDITLVGNLFYRWNNALNYTTGQSAGGTYASATTKGYNVFVNMVAKNVPENTAVAGTDGITQSTDRPANNTSNTSAVTDLRNTTYGQIDARVISGANDALGLDASNNAYQMNSWPLYLRTSGRGTVARSLPNGSDQWVAPTDAGCYANPQADMTITATPATGWTFSHWYGSVTGTDNPNDITLDSTQVIWATFSKP